MFARGNLTRALQIGKLLTDFDRKKDNCVGFIFEHCDTIFMHVSRTFEAFVVLLLANSIA